MKRIMNRKKAEEIVISYRFHDDGEVSDETLIQMVCDDCSCDAGDVAEALAMSMTWSTFKYCSEADINDKAHDGLNKGTMMTMALNTIAFSVLTAHMESPDDQNIKNIYNAIIVASNIISKCPETEIRAAFDECDNLLMKG